MRSDLQRIMPAILLLAISCGAFAAHPDAQSSSFGLDTSVTRLDSDSDGMVDSWEILHGLNISSNDANLNPDGDAFTNIEEYNAGLDPNLSEPVGLPQAFTSFSLHTRGAVIDTDGDSIPDWWELLHGLNISSNDAALDSDGDDRSNLSEFDAGTDPRTNDWLGPCIGESETLHLDTGGYSFDLTADSDEDGMPDWWEFRYGLQLGAKDGDADLDGDGISNLDEYLLGLIPNINDDSSSIWGVSSLWHMDTAMRPPDTDGDGMRDWWEQLYGLNISSNDAAIDSDDDGRTNLEEYNAGTDPLIDDWRGPTLASSTNLLVDTGGFNGGFADDTDSDGMPDWWEMRYQLNPGVNDSTGNPDEDALNNLEEYNAGTDPRVYDWFNPEDAESLVFLLDTGGRWIDTDGDGIPNWWERIYASNTTNMPPNADADNDGLSNLEEYISHCDPGDPNSVFHIASLTKPNPDNPSEWTLTWQSAPDRLYTLYCHTNLMTQWSPSCVYQVQGDGTQKSYTNTTASTAPQFYRLAVEMIAP
jgi:hypothetical protein